MNKITKAVVWADAMEELGLYLETCDCGGPILATEDSAYCYKCATETGMHLLPKKTISDHHGRRIVVNATGEID